MSVPYRRVRGSQRSASSLMPRIASCGGSEDRSGFRMSSPATVPGVAGERDRRVPKGHASLRRRSMFAMTITASAAMPASVRLGVPPCLIA